MFLDKIVAATPMQTSDKIAFAAFAVSALALLVSVAVPLTQFAYGRLKRQREKLQLRVGTVAPGQVAVEVIFQADHGYQGLLGTLHVVRPRDTRVVMFSPGVQNDFTGESTEHGFEDADTDLPRTVGMVPVEGEPP